ncbi:TraB/GumN family protein [Henriciella litoralis]|uniref:TraB/GumN family protein n=1 Tax=Henriciella litoralis TaxID=568102 RepID=UPI000A041EE6|nr:TraB/GumN family protein [Henriciella litoralis]
MTFSLPRAAAVSGLALTFLLAGCGTQSDEPTTPAQTEEDVSIVEATTETEAPEDVRRDREDILAEFETALAEAKATSGSGSPALWTLSDDDTTIYIFGTVHLMRPDMEWRTAEFSEAFDSADKLVLELDMESPEGQREMAKDFMSKGLYGDGRTLSSELSEGDLEALESALDSLGLPIAAINPMEPWMAAINLSVLRLQKDGFDPNAGVEQILLADAHEDGKSFGYLETASIQADIFDTLPEPVQKEYLYETALTLDDTTKMLDQVVEEWSDGDVAGLGTLVANPDTGGGEGVYDALFLSRNQNWAPKIADMLDEPGTVFIAVGAGHLAGPDSVITMLRDEGYEVEGP